jgi:uncharacterized protein YjiS (DUF1127 family)
MRSSGSETRAPSLVSTGWREIEQLLVNVLEQVLVWHQRMIERRQLAALSDVELRDIGLSRTDIAGEINKPFWRV